jgi:hypothetical protein
MVKLSTSLTCAIALTLGACGDDAHEADATDTIDVSDLSPGDESSDTRAPVLPDASAIDGPQVVMDPARTAFFGLPVPAPDLFGADGHPTLSRWPRDGAGASFVEGLIALAETTDGASLAGSVFFQLDRDVADVATRVTGHFIDLDPSSPERGVVRPGRLHYEPDGGPFGAPHLVSLQPIQGIPLRPRTTYAAVLVAKEAGLGRSQTLADLLAGRPIPGLAPHRAAWDDAVQAVADADLEPAAVVGLTTFHTANVIAQLGSVLAQTYRGNRPATPAASDFSLVEVHDRFCVYGATLALPDYQRGEPPFSTPPDGTWQFEANGRPILQRWASSRLFVTIPRAPSTESGYPFLVFIRTGGGGDRPLIDRGPRAVPHGEPIVPTGTGPATNLAAAGWAGVTWDGPHGGARNPTNADEQFLMFNVTNLAATRDNVRQSALEAALIGNLTADLEIDTSLCPGASATAHFDAQRMGIMGHSMGGWIAPLAMAIEPRFRHAILSGAGGGWMANIVYKRSPVDVRPLAEVFLGYDAVGRTIGMHDPALTLLQWGGESSDPQNYGRDAMSPGRHVLMIEGIVDTYILPPIAQATALSLDLALVGPSWDRDDPRLAEFEPLADLLAEIPTALKRPHLDSFGQRVTAAVVQSPGDAIEDGHEAMFQTPGPKHQYRCFLETGEVARPADEWSPCTDFLTP